MGKKSTLLLGIGLVIVLAAAGFLYTRLAPTAENGQLADEPAQSQDSSASSSQQQANPAPSFPMEDSQGNTVQLSDFLGDKPVFLNFWASTCPPCKQEMPDIQSLYEQYGDDIQFILVNVGAAMNDTREKAQTYLSEEKFTFPVYYDVDYQAITTYGINSFPFSFFIDAQGNVVTYGKGMLSASLLQKGLNLIAPEVVPAP